MVKRRTAREEGHRRKFLAVIDGTPECGRAVVYGASRAARTGGGLVLLYVIPPGDFQHWLGVEEIMRAEAIEGAEASLATFAELARNRVGVDPECVVREGAVKDEIVALIDADPDIAILVLAAATSSEGPGPLISSLASKSGTGFPIPVTIIPGHMSDEDIIAVA
ncbi:universal stress protein [Methylobrevis albus]|uniref:Universal stress protein n=1 Tax=Methylobrevis albus TaxID=2793297 RepID=A0A931I385_9HYPH|nr:universal stress protein [Methylobrevis albus]MBH0238624.1 universal stress protein [Methylobrevis albus]